MTPAYCEHDPLTSRNSRARATAEAAVKDLDQGIAEMHKRLEADGNLCMDRQEKVIMTMSGVPGGVYLDSPEEDTPVGECGDAESPLVGLLVSDRCQHLIREFLGYTEDHVGTAVAQDHCLDALRYACMGVTGQ